MLSRTRIKLFDYAYGFLCLQVMALSVMVAILSQTSELEPFLLTLSKQPTEEPLMALHACVRAVEKKAFYPPEDRGHIWILGWYKDETGEFGCLPQMGGFTIHDATYLISKLWNVRSQFLDICRRAAAIFPAWGSFLSVIGHTFVENYGVAGSKFADMKV